MREFYLSKITINGDETTIAGLSQLLVRNNKIDLLSIFKPDKSLFIFVQSKYDQYLNDANDEIQKGLVGKDLALAIRKYAQEKIYSTPDGQKSLSDILGKEYIFFESAIFNMRKFGSYTIYDYCYLHIGCLPALFKPKFEISKNNLYLEFITRDDPPLVFSSFLNETYKVYVKHEYTDGKELTVCEFA